MADAVMLGLRNLSRRIVAGRPATPLTYGRGACAMQQAPAKGSGTVFARFSNTPITSQALRGRSQIGALCC